MCQSKKNAAGHKKNEAGTLLPLPLKSWPPEMPLFSCGILLNRLISEARWEDARTPEKPFKRILFLQENVVFILLPGFPCKHTSL